MFNKKIFYHFYLAIQNEIGLDNDAMHRLYDTGFSYTPIRPTKSFDLIQKYHINKFFYSIICILFVLFSPIYFFIKLIKDINLRSKKSKIDTYEHVVLIANGRIEYLYNKLENKHNTTYININQKINKNHLSIHNLLAFRDYLKAYIYAVVSVFYILFKIRNKTDIIQVYVAYEWFLTYIALDSTLQNMHHVYFANHYDRWATMFDTLLRNKKLILLQHGVLPKDLNLSYKLRNLHTIYTLNNDSIYMFKNLFDCKNTNFDTLDISLHLTKIENETNTILIIGQPHSIIREIEIVKYLQKHSAYQIYIKPHPLYSIEEYKQFSHIKIIEDRSFFPKVAVALCYESTLGLEYEASGIKVIWWRGLNIEDITSRIQQAIKD